jgi:hypothetical protein
MSRKNVAKVVSKFVAAQAGKGDTHGAIWTDGDTIYSYAMPIATRIGQMAVYVSEDSPTVTTTIHRNNVRELLLREGYRISDMPRDAVKTASQSPAGKIVWPLFPAR